MSALTNKSKKNLLDPSREKGFTLLEVMVTISIIAIALISLFDLQTQTISMNMESGFYATAPFLAQKKLAELELSPIHEMASGSGDFSDEFPGYTWKVTVEDIQSEALKTGSILFKKIDVLIGFHQEALQYEMRIYRTFQG